LRLCWPDAPEELVSSLKTVVAYAGEHAAAPTNVGRVPAAFLAAELAAEQAPDPSARAVVRTVTFAATVIRADDVATVAATAAAAVSSADRDTGSRFTVETVDAIRTDFQLLVEKAAANHWDSNTPVSPDVFGPLWPLGAPKGWPIETSER
jgi:hypothetical protein